VRGLPALVQRTRHAEKISFTFRSPGQPGSQPWAYQCNAECNPATGVVIGIDVGFRGHHHRQSSGPETLNEIHLRRMREIKSQCTIAAQAGEGVVDDKFP
jgi:hypothetical protein